jgi:hypothetical protein
VAVAVALAVGGRTSTAAAVTDPPCLTRWGGDQPAWVCDWLNGGHRPTLAGVDAGNAALGVVLVGGLVVALILLAVLDGLRGHRTWRDWFNSLR